jgi:hypothetical protein
MNPWRYVIIAIIMSLLLFPECTLDSNIAGGSSTETVNACVILANGSPARNAVVRVIDADGWLDSIGKKKSPVIDSVKSDSNGTISLKKSMFDKLVNLQVDHEYEGFFKRAVTISMINDTFRLSRYSSLYGQRDTSFDSSSEFYISGTAYAPVSCVNDVVSFVNIPPETYSVVLRNKNSSRVTPCAVVSSTAGAKQAIRWSNVLETRLLIDNFDEGMGPSSIGLIQPKVYWRASNGSAISRWDFSLNKFVVSATTNNSPAVNLFTFTDNSGNKCGKIFFKPDTISGSSFSVSGGVSFRELRTSSVDLSSMKSFSFTALGCGVLWVKLRSANVDNLSSESNYCYSVALSQTVKKLTIPVDSLKIIPALSSYTGTWMNDSKQIMAIDFEFSSVANTSKDLIYAIIDDIYLNNVGIDIISGK